MTAPTNGDAAVLASAIRLALNHLANSHDREAEAAAGLLNAALKHAPSASCLGPQRAPRSFDRYPPVRSTL